MLCQLAPLQASRRSGPPGAWQRRDAGIGCTRRAALRARFDANATFLRLPFERIDAATDEHLHLAVLKRRVSNDFFEVLQRNI